MSVTKRTLTIFLGLVGTWFSIAEAQSLGSPNSANSVTTPRPFDPGSNSTNPSALAVQAQNPYLGSVSTGPLVKGILPLSLHEAVTRALRANLGLIDSVQDNALAKATRMRVLSQLLPQISAEAAQNYQNLAESTIRIKTVAPAYNFEAAHVFLSQRIVDVAAVHNAASARYGIAASTSELVDSRNIVVLAATSSYLLVTAGQIRV